VFASHPDNDTRLQQVVAEAGRLPAGGGRIDREEFLRQIDQLLFADSPSQGIVRNDNFYHTELGLALTFPHNWRIKNQPDRVSATNSGNAERKLARPLTLRIINAPPGATFADMARGSPLGKNAVSHLPLLNGMYPNGEPAAGQPLKVIE
jgi:predicted Zn-dependent protease